MPLSWDREYDFTGSSLPVFFIPQAVVGPEDDDDEDNFDDDDDGIGTYGAEFDDEDDDDFDSDPLYEPSEPSDYFPMIDGGTDSDDGTEMEDYLADDGYGDDA